MGEDRDDVTQPLDQIACEQEAIDQLAEGTLRLQTIQQAKLGLAVLDAEVRRLAVARRRAALEVSA